MYATAVTSNSYYPLLFTKLWPKIGSNSTVSTAGNGTHLSSVNFPNLQYPAFGHFNL